MISRHTDKSESTRVPPDVSEAARAQLDAAGWNVWQFLGACLAAVARKPAEVLALVEPYKPARKTQGRPPKARDLLNPTPGPAAKRFRDADH